MQAFSLLKQASKQASCVAHATTAAAYSAMQHSEQHLRLMRSQASTSATNVDAAGLELLQSAVTAEVQKLAGKSGDSKATSDIERDMSDQMVRLSPSRSSCSTLV